MTHPPACGPPGEPHSCIQPITHTRVRTHTWHDMHMHTCTCTYTCTCDMHMCMCMCMHMCTSRGRALSSQRRSGRSTCGARWAARRSRRRSAAEPSSCCTPSGWCTPPTRRCTRFPGHSPSLVITPPGASRQPAAAHAFPRFPGETSSFATTPAGEVRQGRGRDTQQAAGDARRCLHRPGRPHGRPSPSVDSQ